MTYSINRSDFRCHIRQKSPNFDEISQLSEKLLAGRKTYSLCVLIRMCVLWAFCECPSRQNMSLTAFNTGSDHKDSCTFASLAWKTTKPFGHSERKKIWPTHTLLYTYVQYRIVQVNCMNWNLLLTNGGCNEAYYRNALLRQPCEVYQSAQVWNWCFCHRVENTATQCDTQWVHSLAPLQARHLSRLFFFSCTGYILLSCIHFVPTQKSHNLTAHIDHMFHNFVFVQQIFLTR